MGLSVLSVGQITLGVVVLAGGAALALWQDYRDGRTTRSAARSVAAGKAPGSPIAPPTAPPSALAPAPVSVSSSSTCDDAGGAPGGDALAPWAATYCPGCLEEARVRFPTIEPHPSCVALACGRHLSPVVARRIATITLSCGRTISRQVIEVTGYERLWAATDEEVAASGWARCIWN